MNGWRTPEVCADDFLEGGLVLPGDAPASWERCLVAMLEEYGEIERVYFSQVYPGGEAGCYHLLVSLLGAPIEGIRLRELRLKYVHFLRLDSRRPVRHMFALQGDGFSVNGFVKRVCRRGSLLYCCDPGIMPQASGFRAANCLKRPAAPGENRFGVRA